MQKPKKWDGHWRIIFFDIKESKKNVRDALRHHLKNLNCYPLQKSVFVTPYPCKEEIDFLCEFYEGGTEIILAEAISLGKNEKTVRAHFGI